MIIDRDLCGLEKMSSEEIRSSLEEFKIDLIKSIDNRHDNIIKRLEAIDIHLKRIDAKFEPLERRIESFESSNRYKYLNNKETSNENLTSASSTSKYVSNNDQSNKSRTVSNPIFESGGVIATSGEHNSKS